MDPQHEPGPRERGRTDPPHELRERLSTAPPAYVEGALQNPHLDEGLVLVMLRNAGLSASVLLQLGNDDRFLRSDDVKGALVRHAATPRAISMHLVKFLPWQALCAISGDRDLQAPIRALAEQVLVGRLNQLPAMEKSKLARNGGRAILGALLHSRDIKIIPDLLRNPRIAERDVAGLVRDRATPSTLLGVLARDEKWSHRPSVRLALVENHSTPLADAVRLLAELPAVNLRTIRQNPRLPARLRAEAGKQLQKRLQGRPGAR